MKTLQDPAITTETLTRIGKLHADTRHQWGKMNAHQMMCHLTDSFALAMGERTAAPATNLLARTLVKGMALRLPVQWPKGVPTRPEMDQLQGGTPPTAFAGDQQKLAAVITRFARPGHDFAFGFHPYFGNMSEWEWLRWGYLHTDHHLRQFGV
jgi:Protein of unknown function (DUF1569)